MPKYELREEGYVFATVDAESAEAALDDADEPDRSDYNDDDGRTATIWVEWYAVNTDDDDDRASKTWTLEPDEPECSGGGDHDWQSPFEIVGGVRENPGVWGHGGGVTIDECCMRCGCRKHTDTWATNPTDGTQGHTTIAYEPGGYVLDFDDEPDSERDDEPAC
jgi:hypothetical protein